MIDQKEISTVCKFQKTHALKGELNAILDIDSDFVAEGNALIIEMDGIYVPFYAESIRPKGSTSYLIKLDGVNSEGEAKIFVNKPIYALKAELAPFLELEQEDLLDEDDLVGYKVVDAANNVSLGVIASVDSTTENLLFVIETDNGEIIYAPAVDEFIEEVDDAEMTIKMSLPDGLIELNKKS